MKAKSTFLAWNVLPPPTWAPGSPNDDGPGLPMARARRQYKPREADHPVDVGLLRAVHDQTRVTASLRVALRRRGAKFHGQGLRENGLPCARFRSTLQKGRSVLSFTPDTGSDPSSSIRRLCHANH